MKKTIFLLLLSMMSLFAKGQSIIITEDENQFEPNPSAIFEIQSHNKGILIPRLSTESILEMEFPEPGLLVFDIDRLTFTYFDGSAWLDLFGLQVDFCFGEPQTMVWRDSDGDGYGCSASLPMKTCIIPLGYVSNNDDCNDIDPNINPNAKDICNGRDDDCDRFVDEDENPTKVWHDSDGDGFGDRTSDAFFVCVPGPGQVTNNDDCDDNDSSVNPNAKDICNGKDDDCDRFVDEDENPTKVWHDSDGDGFGDRTSNAFFVCVPGPGQVTNNDDCDDNDPNVNPNAKDICNGRDDDCDGFFDEDGYPSVFYLDSDGDGYGDPSKKAILCVQPSTYVTNMNDCDDSNALIYQGASELPDGLDNDCDGIIDN